MSDEVQHERPGQVSFRENSEYERTSLLSAFLYTVEYATLDGHMQKSTTLRRDSLSLYINIASPHCFVCMYNSYFSHCTYIPSNRRTCAGPLCDV